MIIQFFYKILCHFMEGCTETFFLFLIPDRKITEPVCPIFYKNQLRHEQYAIRIKQMILYGICHFHKLYCKAFDIFFFHLLSAVPLLHAHCIPRIKCVSALPIASASGHFQKGTDVIVAKHAHLIVLFIRHLHVDMNCCSLPFIFICNLHVIHLICLIRLSGLMIRAFWHISNFMKDRCADTDTLISFSVLSTDTLASVI